MNKPAVIRTDYSGKPLDLDSVAPDPLEQLQTWFDEAVAAEIPDVNAMTLATIGLDGSPRARMVLMKGLSQDGVSFFTNYDSDKGEELAADGRVSLCFFWQPLSRQVRIVGVAQRVPAEASSEYFLSRPLLSRLGAWASPQSRQIESREWLQGQFAHYKDRFGDEVPRPEHWGGYIVTPHRCEFWQGRRARLHDRVVYDRDGDGDGDAWVRTRLAP
ncbi:MAG: pyridoxamine 5'-phosphate oxidase [Bradymonadia bacterium]|jgi:pyridoxamine 5'-phosphate oxidase